MISLYKFKDGPLICIKCGYFNFHPPFLKILGLESLKNWSQIKSVKCHQNFILEILSINYVDYGSIDHRLGSRV